MNELEESGKILHYLTEQYVKYVEKSQLTNTQWFIDWEIEMNKLTVKDHNT